MTGACRLLFILTINLFLTVPGLAETGDPDVGSAAFPSPTAQKTDLLEDEANTVSVIEQLGPSAVSINVSLRGRRVDPFEGEGGGEVPEFFRDLIPPMQGPPQRGSGSGF